MNKIIIGDADSLIALADKQDANYEKSKQISRLILIKNYQIIYPNTAILESITALARAKNLPDKARLITKQYIAGIFTVEYVDVDLQLKAASFFQTKSHSKKNTIFDAIVAATAEKLEAEAIFSFDEWYPKLGFKLATGLV